MQQPRPLALFIPQFVKVHALNQAQCSDLYDKVIRQDGQSELY